MNLNKELFSKPPLNEKFYIIAIDGRGGAGKTLLSEHLASLLPDFIFINGDDYFEPSPGEPAWGVFNEERFGKDIVAPLREAKVKILSRPYEWHHEPPIVERILKIRSGVCVERCFSFVFDLNYDLKIWIETPKEICLERGLSRDKAVPNSQQVWRTIWQPAENKYLETVRPLKVADIVVDGTKPYSDQLSL